MSAIRIDGEEFVVEAEDLARAFGVSGAEVLDAMRSGQLTSRCEKGIDEHEGRHRLTFTWQGRVLRLTVDGGGRILSRVMVAPPPERETKPACPRG